MQKIFISIIIFLLFNSVNLWGWIYPEHRDIALFAIQNLNPDLTDIYWRQYFIRVAMDIVDIKKFDAKVSENMTAEQVADYLQVDKKTIRKWTSERKIPNVKLGSAVRYQKERIDTWLKSKEKKVVRGKVSK